MDNTLTATDGGKTDLPRGTIALDELLKEIDGDVERLRDKKGFYGVGLWWQLERDRLASKYGAIDCSAAVPTRRKKWRRRVALPGRAFDLLLALACIALGLLVLL